MTLEQIFFWIYAAIAAVGAVAVVVSQNVVRMAMWLIFSLGATAGLFFLLNADFVGATQLLIYVGGTLVLLIFGVMLTATGPYVQLKTAPAEGFLAAGVGVLFLAMIVATVAAIDWDDRALRLNELADVEQTAFEEVLADPRTSETQRELLGESYVLAADAGAPRYVVRPDLAPERRLEVYDFWQGRSRSTVRPLGLAFLGVRPDKADSESAVGYLLPFEIISVHLLVVLIGAAYLARAKRRVAPADGLSS